MKPIFVLALAAGLVGPPVFARSHQRQAGTPQTMAEAIRYEKWKLKTSEAEATRPRTLRTGTQETKADEANVRGTAARGEVENTAGDPGEKQYRERRQK
jgi:hypothetical protein